MVEIRQARPDEMSRFAHVAGAALLIQSDTAMAIQPDWTTCAFDGGRLVTTYAEWPFTLRFNGNALPFAGVTFVSTDPLYRGQGNLRKIMESAFKRLYDAKQQPLAALYASQAAIYQRFGYGVVSTHNRYVVEPRYLRFANPVEIPGKLREINPQDEFPLLVEVFRKFREDRIGYIHRGRSSWDYGAIEKAPVGSFQRGAVYEAGGEAQGYVVYRLGPSGFDGPGPGQAVTITDLAWLNPAAYAALWRPFEGMALAREVRWGSVPTDDPLPHLLLEPRMLRTTSRDGLLARIIDVPSVLAARPYEEEQLLRFEVSDAMAPWNAGRWSFETAKEGATVKPEGGSQVDLSMDIGTLAMLVFGQITATQAARMGRVEVHDQRALARWDTALRTKYRPFCPDQF